MMNDAELVQNIIAEQDTLKKEQKVRVLKEYISHLLNHDFEKLVNILYRIDVEEKKLKTVLQGHPHQDAAAIIVQLMIDRQQQKFVFKNQSQTESDIPEDEKW